MSKSSQEQSRVVITGFGVITNIGLDADATWDAMVRGRSGIAHLDEEWLSCSPREQWSTSIAGFIRDFDPAQRIPHREARRMDHFCQVGVWAGMEAVAHSGIDFESDAIDNARCGIVIGSGIGGISSITEAARVLDSKGAARINAFTVPKLMANAVTGDLSIRYGLQGHSSSHTTACASAGHSISEAYHVLKRGDADVMLAGGAEGATDPMCLGAFMTMKALSSRNDAPEQASRPFDKDRDGFVLSEGAGVLVLETEEHAKKRGATIYAELVGAAASSDAGHITAPDPQGRGAKRAMEGALREAQLNTDDIDYINAHGTSTPLGDAAEVSAVLSLFGDHARKSAGGSLMMSSTKSMIGHCLGASGAVESLACIGAIRHGVVTPTINLDNPDDGFDLDLVPHAAKDAKVRYCMNNTFGFGGHNVSMVIGAYDG